MKFIDFKSKCESIGGDVVRLNTESLKRYFCLNELHAYNGWQADYSMSATILDNGNLSICDLK